MPLTTTELALNTKAPEFALIDVTSDKLYSLHDLVSKKATVIMFLCNHCPYVQHILGELVVVVKEYQEKGVNFVGISSNDVENYPEDGPEEMKALAKEYGFTFPYLYDQTQQTAHHYHAVCTPEFFVYDQNMRLAYHGCFDESRPRSQAPVTGQDLRNALDALLTGERPTAAQQPSIGCGIKWK
jgi:peroxiredoxin